MRVATYYRFSTDNPEQWSNSERRQRDSVERHIFSRGWTEVASFTDKGVSGNKTKPNLMQLKELIESKQLHVDVICVDDQSRLTRKGLLDIGEDLNWIRHASIKLCIVDENHGDPFDVVDLNADVKASVSSWANHEFILRTSKRIVSGLRVKFKNKEVGWIGRPPLGYDIVRYPGTKKSQIPSHLKCNNELPIAKAVFDNILDGNSINSCIPIILGAQRYKDNPSLQPNQSSILSVLRNSIYAGIRTIGVRGVGEHNRMANHSHKWVKGHPLSQCADFHEYEADGYAPCISLEDFNRVQVILNNNQINARKFPDRCKYLFSGLLRCDHCGAVMNAAPLQDENYGGMRYVCPNSANKNRRGCRDDDTPNRKQIRDDEIAPLIQSALNNILTDRKFHENTIRDILKRLADRQKNPVAVIEEDIFIQQKRLNEVVELFRTTGGESLKEAIRDQTAKIEKLRVKAVELSSDDGLLDLCLQQKQSMGLDDNQFLYFAYAYEAAQDILQQCKQVLLGAEGEQYSFSVEECISDEANILAEMTSHFAEGSSGAVAGISEAFEASFSAESLLAILKAMGLESIRIRFEMGIWRGKSRRVPVEAMPVFLVTSQNHMLKRVVARRARFEILKSAKEGRTDANAKR